MSAATRTPPGPRVSPRPKDRVLLLGKLPPPYIGPAIATQILLSSTLRHQFELEHVNTNVHESIRTVGRYRLGNVPRHLGVYAKLAGTLARFRPQLVLVPISQSAGGFLKDSGFVLLSRLFGRRVVLQLRGSSFRNWLRTQPLLMRGYVRAILRAAEGIIVLGQNLRSLFADVYPPDRIFVVPNGVNLKVPDSAGRAASGDVRLLYVGNLQPSKGIEDVIRAVAELRDQAVAPFHLDVIGAWRDGATEQTCMELVRRLVLPVTFRGVLTGDDKLRALADADVFVFTPREPEGHPWVIVEALAAGLPVVSTDQGAIVESVVDGCNGFVVRDRCPGEIAERLARLIGNAELRRRFGAASRSRYEHEFTEEKMVERMSAVFQALGSPRSSAKIVSHSSSRSTECTS